ncbi:MAG: response regulator [Verrucomicrobia bacterium]|nr:MAG: response regulator [Verrucomicrobiota bacterium]
MTLRSQASRLPPPLISIRIEAERDIVLARLRARQVAQALERPHQDQIRLATITSEFARNIHQYTPGGRIDFHLASWGGNPALIIRAIDRGKGIPNADAILSGNYTSTTGMGVGLIGARRMLDHLEIASAPEGGSIVTGVRLLDPDAAPPSADAVLRRLDKLIREAAEANPINELQTQNQELIQALDALRQRERELEAANKRLTETNQGILTLHRELEEKAANLKRADEMKSRVLSQMSHEFRTPLNAIIALAGLLLDRTDGDLNAEQETQLSLIKRSGEELLGMVNDLLDLAKIEAGKLTADIAPCDLTALLGAIRGVMRPLVTSPEVELIVADPPPELGLIETDEGKLAQIFRNLLSNAIKFTERGHVRLDVAPDGPDHIRFTVSDTGIGIPPEHLDRIFEEFQQVTNPLQRKHKGTGLGLPLCKKLAELLGGSLSVESTLGRGTTFTLRLPRHGPDAAGPARETRETQTASASAETAAPTPAEKPRPAILIIEDNEAAVALYRAQLRDCGFDILHAADPAEALAILEKQRPAAIIADILFSSEPAWEFIARLRKNPATADIPLFICSVLDERKKGLDLGADDYCIKPVPRDWILRKLDKLGRPSATVLVIDDDETARYIARRNLEDSVAEILEAPDGPTGIELAAKHRPDLIILDLNMPGMSGFEVIETLRRRPEIRDIPTIICTSEKLDSEARERLQRQALSVLSKEAWSSADVVARLRRFLAKLSASPGSPPASGSN